MSATPSAPPALFITYGIGRGSRLVAGEEQDGILEAVMLTSLSRSRILLAKGPAVELVLREVAGPLKPVTTMCTAPGAAANAAALVVVTAVATVSKKWFRVADSYGVEVAPDQDPVVILAVTVAIDMMAHESR